MNITEALANEPYRVVDSEWFKKAVEEMAQVEKLHPRAPLDALLLAACRHLPLKQNIED